MFGDAWLLGGVQQKAPLSLVFRCQESSNSLKKTLLNRRRFQPTPPRSGLCVCVAPRLHHGLKVLPEDLRDVLEEDSRRPRGLVVQKGQRAKHLFGAEAIDIPLALSKSVATKNRKVKLSECSSLLALAKPLVEGPHSCRFPRLGHFSAIR